MAGNKELIDDIVDPIAVKQVDDLNKKIQELEATFISAAKEASNLNSKAGSANGLAKFNAAADKSAIATQRLINLQTQQAATQAKINDIQEKAAQRREAIEAKEIANEEKKQAVIDKNAQKQAAIDAKKQAELEKQIAIENSKTKTIISNSQAEIDAYNKVAQGEENITTTISKRNQAEGKAANDAAARSAKAIAQQQAQAAEYVRAQGLIEKLQIKLKGYKQAQLETTDPRALEIYNGKIQKTEDTIKQLSNVGKDGFDSLGNAVKKSGNLLQTVGQKVVTLARLLPGIGVVGLIAFATEPIIEYISQLDIFKKKADAIVSDTAIDSTDFKNALSAVNSLKTSIDEFNTGTISGKELVDRYNESIGQTAGILTTTTEVENFYNSRADAYVQAIYLRAKANAALQASTDKLAEAQKRAIDGPTLGDKILAGLEVGGSNKFTQLLGPAGTIAGYLKLLTKDGQKAFKALSLDQQAKAVDALNKKGQDGLKLFDQLKKESDKFNRDNGFGDLDGAKREQARLKAIEDAKKRAAAAKKAAEDASKAEDEAQKRALEDRKRYLDSILKLEEEAAKEEADLRKKNLQDAENFENDANNTRLLMADKIATEEYALAVQQYKDRLITEQEFQKIKQDIERESALRSIDSAITEAENLIEIQRSFGKDTQAEEDKLAALKIKRSKLVLDNTLSDIEKEKEARKSLKDLTKQVEQEAANFVIQLVDAGFENRKNQLQQEINLTDEKAKAEIDAVNRSLISNSEKADKIKLIEAQADAQKKQLQRQQKQADIEKAKFDKAVALARIVQATAEAEIQALSYLSNPLTAPLYPGIAALIGALGAIQLATVLAQPIPAYEKGTNNAKGGVSLVGEKGTEYVITPQGATFLTPNKPTLMDIPKGSTVIPHLQTARMMDVKNYAGGQATDMSQVVQAIKGKEFKTGKTVIRNWHRELSASAQWEQRKNQYFN